MTAKLSESECKELRIIRDGAAWGVLPWRVITSYIEDGLVVDHGDRLSLTDAGNEALKNDLGGAR